MLSEWIVKGRPWLLFSALGLLVLSEWADPCVREGEVLIVLKVYLLYFLPLVFTIVGMDEQKGALLAWMSIIFFKRDARDKWEKKQWLPEVPALGHLLHTSSDFPWSEECYQEVLLLGRAAGYPFVKFLDQLGLPRNSYGGCFANPITVDTTSNSSSSNSTGSGSSFSDPVTPRVRHIHSIGDGCNLQTLDGSGIDVHIHADISKVAPSTMYPGATSMISMDYGGTDGHPCRAKTEVADPLDSPLGLRDEIGGSSFGTPHHSEDASLVHAGADEETSAEDSKESEEVSDWGERFSQYE